MCVGAWVAMGLLTGKIINHIGVRLTILLGGCISSLGLFVSGFANSLYLLFFTYGVLIGAGSSMVYLASIVAIGKLFHKNRSFATGINTAGSGMST